MADGRSWFITGVSSGIGRALAAAALARGERVIGTVRRAEELARFAAAAPGGRATAFALDLDDHAAIAGVAARAVAEAGRIDVVVNNAGRSLWSSLEDTPLDEAKALFATNVFGPLAVMQAFLPHFRERGEGVFVNMSSGCGLFGVPGVGAYCASKFALEGLSETLAAEAAPFGVRVMLVEPGAVMTRFVSDNTREIGAVTPAYEEIARGKAALDKFYQAHAMRPEQVAAEIIRALDASSPPLRLMLGETRQGAQAKFQILLQQASGVAGA